MLLVRRPSEDAIRSYLAAQRGLPFSYPEVGATSAAPPPGYTVDHGRVRLGEGPEVYARAVEALRRWVMFRIGWVELLWPDAPIEAGTVVGILIRVGAFCLNAVRIVYVVDELGPPRRFGFAYGTLPDHVERGEERFTVEWNEADGSVWYDLLAFSTPNHPLVKALYPLARRMQKRFSRDSIGRMAQAVGA